MKVLLISNMYPKGESHFGGFVKIQSEALEKEGIQVVRAVRTQYSRVGYLRFAVSCLRALLFERYDIVHAHYGFHSGLLPAVLKRKPLIVTYHGSDAQVEPFRNRLYFHLHSFVLRRCDRVISVSEAIRNLLVSNFCVHPDSVSVISCGVDTSVFQPLSEDQIAKERGFTSADKIVLFAGKLDYMKGVDLLYKCARDMQEVLFILVGEGDKKCDLPNCRFLGPIPNREIPFWMNLADVFVLPSRSEGTPVVVLEAFACGTPVITSDVGGCAQLVQDGCTGFIFPSGDGNALRGKLSCLLKDTRLRKTFADNARKKVIECFDNALIAKKIISLYSNTIDEMGKKRQKER